MIGILCERYKKKTYSKRFFKILNINKGFIYKTEAVIVFSISDLDLANKTVSGNLVTRDGIKLLKAPIPRIINNLLIPQKRTSKKLLRTLAEQTDIILINEGNRFEQSMIMEMLLSSAKTRDFVPDYYIYDSNSDINRVLQTGESLILPEAGNNCKAFYTTGDIEKNPSLISKKRWLVLEIPNTIKQNGSPTVFTLYAVRDEKDKWNTLPLSKSSAVQMLCESASEIAECIGRFIPSLAFCTIRFVIKENNSPLFAGFAGWDPSLVLKKQGSGSLSLFANYFFGYNNLLLHSQGEKNHVG